MFFSVSTLEHNFDVGESWGDFGSGGYIAEPEMEPEEVLSRGPPSKSTQTNLRNSAPGPSVIATSVPAKPSSTPSASSSKQGAEQGAASPEESGSEFEDVPEYSAPTLVEERSPATLPEKSPVFEAVLVLQNSLMERDFVDDWLLSPESGEDLDQVTQAEFRRCLDLSLSQLEDKLISLIKKKGLLDSHDDLRVAAFRRFLEGEAKFFCLQI